jgi:hypothetical protein
VYLGCPAQREYEVQAIRIVLGTMPPMLRDIIRGVLAGQPDMVIVRDTRTDEDLIDVLMSEAADVIVVQQALHGDGDGRFLHGREAAAAVLCLSPDGRSAALYELQSRRTMIVNVSPDGLRSSIRTMISARVTASGHVADAATVIGTGEP